MNNIFLPNDPLLYGQTQTDYRQLYEQQLLKDRELFNKQYGDYMRKAQPAYEDKIAQLNASIRELSPEIKNELQYNTEFVELNTQLQECVQAELLELVKNNINSNPELTANIGKQIQIISDLSSKVKEQDRQNIAQINDYLKNYSSMTFDEYKKLKNI